MHSFTVLAPERVCVCDNYSSTVNYAVGDLGRVGEHPIELRSPTTRKIKELTYFRIKQLTKLASEPGLGEPVWALAVDVTTLNCMKCI